MMISQKTNTILKNLLENLCKIQYKKCNETLQKTNLAHDK